MKDSSVRRWSAVHRALFRITGGVVGRRLVNNDMLLLTTEGRHTGKPHTVPLLYLTEGEDLIVIASYGGRQHHPDWYLNLAQSPQVSVELPGSRRNMVARTATADERTLLWPRVLGAYDGYSVYQSRTDREIPVVVLEPVTQSSGSK